MKQNTNDGVHWLKRYLESGLKCQLGRWINAVSHCFIICMLVSCDQVATEAKQVNDTALKSSIASWPDNGAIEAAFFAKKSGVFVEGHGVVIKLLVDDTKGAQHQRFLVRMNPQQTLLFAHNIDLAARVPVATGDVIDFKGEYIYNPKGGIMHWTHHDPKQKMAGGWIRHNGQTYQ